VRQTIGNPPPLPPLDLPFPEPLRTYLLRVAGGGAVPEPDHNGLELSVVLSGAFTDGDALFAAGDFAMVDETVTHEPRATPDEECICLVVAAR
tara:strand:+ start:481 stop:759 length:279 start_codon:yes stop_codon:yes gene_type:complete